MLVTSLMKRAENVACATDIIQTVNNSQQSCSQTACERERERSLDVNLNVSQPAWDTDKVGSTSNYSDVFWGGALLQNLSG